MKAHWGSEGIAPRNLDLGTTRVYPKVPNWPPGARTANGTDLCH
jgi:hypothetical protein